MENWLLIAVGDAPPSPGSSILSMLIPLAVVFFVLYWLMIRPQRKAEQQHREMIDALSRGDKVVTIGGIYGQITEIDDKTVTLKVDQNKGVEIKFRKDAVRGVERKKSAEEAPAQSTSA
jgi:preprotein translocase subunit YajC